MAEESVPPPSTIAATSIRVAAASHRRQAKSAMPHARVNAARTPFAVCPAGEITLAQHGVLYLDD